MQWRVGTNYMAAASARLGPMLRETANSPPIPVTPTQLSIAVLNSCNSKYFLGLILQYRHPFRQISSLLKLLA